MVISVSVNQPRILAHEPTNFGELEVFIVLEVSSSIAFLGMKIVR